MPHDAAQAVSRRTAELGEAAIQHMAQRARALQAAGRSIVNLSIGEPDFATPAHICAAAAQAMADGFTHYAPIAGFPELREAIARKLAAENGLEYQPSEIVVSNGAKQAITNAAFATLDPLDEVILVAPFWSSYEHIASLAGEPGGAEDVERGRLQAAAGKSRPGADGALQAVDPECAGQSERHRL